jgi:prophage maintenance system killer protein
MSAIESALRGAQRALDAANDRARDELGEPVVENMLAAYACLGELVARGVDPLAMGQVRHLLEFNAIVLCGTDAARRARYTDHLEATERRFYEERGAGIGDLVETMALNAGEDAFERAAAAYIRMLAQPQLFIEGNHRTGALIISCVLLRAGEPPFVLSAANAAAYFTASGAFRELEKHGLGAMLRAPALRRQFAQFLREESRSEYLEHA